MAFEDYPLDPGPDSQYDVHFKDNKVLLQTNKGI